MVKTYAIIVANLKAFADAHLEVKRFKASFLSQIEPFAAEDRTFPILYATPATIQNKRYTNTYSFTIRCIDKINDAKDNEIAILNSTEQILRDLSIWLKESENGLELENEPMLQPLENYLYDGMTGWEATFDFSGPAFSNECSIPFVDGFLVEYPDGQCDAVYHTKYLTCETLQDCDLIQEILTNVSLSITGATQNGITIPVVDKKIALLDSYVTGATQSNGQLTLKLNNNKPDVIVNIGDFNNIVANSISATTITGTTIYGNGQNLTGVVHSVGLSMPSAFSVANSPITNTGTLAVTATGTTNQFVDGTGSLQLNNNLTLARNPSSYAQGTLYKGTVVYISGSTGNRPNVVRAQANNEPNSSRTYGIVFQDIAQNTDGYILTFGQIATLDTRTNAVNPFTTDSLNDGDIIYLSPTTAGYVTNIKPSAPNHLVYIGTVLRTSPTQGTIDYRIQNGFELGELHNVKINGVSNNDILQYNSSNSVWENRNSLQIATISATTYQNLPVDIRVTGGTYNNATGIATFTNNTGGTFTISGFKTSDLVVTGATKSGSVATFTNNTGGTFTLTGLTDTFVTGGTYNNSTGTAIFTNNTGGTFTISGFKTSDLVVTGGTISRSGNLSTINLVNNTGGTFTVSSIFDTFITGGTYNANTGTLVYTNNSGNTVSISGFYTSANDIYTTGATLNGGVATFTNTTGGTFTLSGFPDAFTTGFTYSNNTFSLLRNLGQSPLTATINTVTGLTATTSYTPAAPLTANTVVINNSFTGSSPTTNTSIITGLQVNMTDGSSSGTRQLRGLDISLPNSQLLFTNNGSPTSTNSTTNLPGLFINRTGSSSFSYMGFATTGRFDTGLRYNTAGNIDIGAFVTGGSYLTFWSNNAEVGRFSTNGNLLVGTTTDAGFRLDVSGTTRLNNIVRIIGTGNTSTSNSFLIFDSGSTQYASFTDYGTLTLNKPQTFIATVNTSAMNYGNVAGGIINLTPSITDNSVAASGFTNGYGMLNIAPTISHGSGTTISPAILAPMARISPTFTNTQPFSYSTQQTSGGITFEVSPTFNSGGIMSVTAIQSIAPTFNTIRNRFDNVTILNIAPTVTGGVPINGFTGTWRGVYYNPTSVGGTHIAFQNTLGNNVFNSSGGNTLVGTATDSGFKLDVNGITRLSQAVNFAVTTVTASTTADTTQNVILVNASGGARTITLPTAVGTLANGRQYTIKKTDNSANAVTVGTTSSQTIDSSTTYSLATQYKYVTVISDGANWFIIANN